MKMKGIEFLKIHIKNQIYNFVRKNYTWDDIIIKIKKKINVKTY